MRILRILRQHIGKRQVRHAVADLALPELLGAAVAVIVDVGRRALRHGVVGNLPGLGPEVRMGGLDGLPELRDAFGIQVHAWMHALRLLERIRQRVEGVAVDDGEVVDLLELHIIDVEIDLHWAVGALLERNPAGHHTLGGGELTRQLLPGAEL
ncbi:MAG TPA: hypothetical protein DGT21_13905 [Armatimonadetes bacterium]|nr:hypothetical protein [Armatimonadota bacterium]